MSDNGLPEGLDRWPHDAYELLGVQRGVAARDLRRAYTQLIRIYKPEQHPEQFRRIREAYDFIQQFGQYYMSPSPEEPTAEVSPGMDEVAPTFSLDMSAASTSAPLPRYSSTPENSRPDDEADRLWDQSCSGDVDAAYHRLRELYLRRPHDSGLVLRLYWLLEAAPDLDPLRHPCDWLVTGLRNQGLMGPCRELYRRVLESHPLEGVGSRCADLLSVQVPPHELLDLVAWRWRAATQLNDWEVIASDLDLLRPRCQREDEDAWCRLLLMAADHLAWERDAPAAMALRDVCAQLENMTQAHQRLAYEFTHLDVLLDLATKWKWMSANNLASGSLLELVRYSWTGALPEYRAALLNYLEEIAQNPNKALETLGGLAIDAPVILGQIGRMLQALQFDAGTPQAENPGLPMVARQLEALLAEVKTKDYHVFRYAVFQFCLRETLTVEHTMEAAANSSDFRAYQSLFQSLYDDLPLRCVCLANRLFWSW